jgi:NAD(P)-dependent dehydrogenase (short-subunit alcohol dehydrogenase family)
MFRFDGKRALIVGGATGMGAAAADLLLELGAEVVVMDFATVDRQGVVAIPLDLRDKKSIDAAVDQCEGRFDALLSCAGIAPGVPGIHAVNFLGQRHLIERMICEDRMLVGSAIAMIASTAGKGWSVNELKMAEYLDTVDFEAGERWLAAHSDDQEVIEFIADYRWSKRAVCTYVARVAFSFMKRGVRINAVMPGTIDTQLARDNEWFTYDQAWRDDLAIERPGPEKAAYPLVFLCSEAASYVSGAMLLVDAGYTPYLEFDCRPA